MTDNADRSAEAEGEADPLTVFIAAHHEARQSNPGTKRFNSGEHLWLGSQGASRACQRQKVSLDLFDFIPRKDGREVLPYEELVALSGDFYRSPQELFEEKRSRLPWGNIHDLEALRNLMGEELRWIEERVKENAEKTKLTPYPEANLRMWWSAKNYVELALNNTDHFGWHNVLCYCLHHEDALRLAIGAAGGDNEAFRRARYTNAFADHFLTDGFAAGHIRVPRAEIRAWAAAQSWSETVAGALSKLLHDQDGHVDVQSLHGVGDEGARPENDGLLVRNAAGVSWYTRCDGQLFAGQEPASRPRVEHAVEAVAASVTELLVAWKTGKRPAETFAATNFVPFPDPAAPRLIEKFPAQMSGDRFDALWNSIAWYTRSRWITGLHEAHVRGLFTALPELMTRFRANVVHDIKTDQRRLRIAPAYLAAFQAIA